MVWFLASSDEPTDFPIVEDHNRLTTMPDGPTDFPTDLSHALYIHGSWQWGLLALVILGYSGLIFWIFYRRGYMRQLQSHETGHLWCIKKVYDLLHQAQLASPSDQVAKARHALLVYEQSFKYSLTLGRNLNSKFKDLRAAVDGMASQAAPQAHGASPSVASAGAQTIIKIAVNNGIGSDPTQGGPYSAPQQAPAPTPTPAPAPVESPAQALWRAVQRLFEFWKHVDTDHLGLVKMQIKAAQQALRDSPAFVPPVEEGQRSGLEAKERS